MSIFDQFFIRMFLYYKGTYKQKANRIALYYICILEVSFILVLGVFFAAFFSQMRFDTIDANSAWTFFVIAALIICFKNWVKYSGKKRMVMNAKTLNKKSNQYNIVLLWMLPLACIGLTFILLKAV